MPVWSLPESLPFFPHPFTSSEEGLLCVSPDLTVEQVITAYAFGIFPWSGAKEPVMWWYTSPRCVLYPTDIKISKSMRRFQKSTEFRVSMNRAFDEVIQACSEPRADQDFQTWIHPGLTRVFCELHKKGKAHSIEVWEDQELIGGLYGLALGKVFFGESMFARKSNTSKLALIHLCQYLVEHGFWIIDCQQTTPHLISMGAVEISGQQWWDCLRENRKAILTQANPST